VNSYVSLLLFLSVIQVPPFYSALCLSSLSYLIISPVPTCLVHNCETSQKSLYFHLLSPLSQDQISFDPHHRVGSSSADCTTGS